VQDRHGIISVAGGDPPRFQVHLRAATTQHGRQGIGVDAPSDLGSSLGISEEGLYGQLMDGDVGGAKGRPGPVAVTPELLGELTRFAQNVLRRVVVTTPRGDDAEQ